MAGTRCPGDGFPGLGISHYPTARDWVGLGCLAAAIVGLAALVGLDLQQHFSNGGATADGFRRVIFQLITATDFPLIAILIDSVVNLRCCDLMAKGSQAQPDLKVAAWSADAELAYSPNSSEK